MHKCKNCGCSLGQLEDGDVVACLRCGQWHSAENDEHALFIRPIKAYVAAALAQIMPPGFDNYKLLEAFDQAEQAMGAPECYYDTTARGYRPTNAVA